MKLLRRRHTVDPTNTGRHRGLFARDNAERAPEPDWMRAFPFNRPEYLRFEIEQRSRPQRARILDPGGLPDGWRTFCQMPHDHRDWLVAAGNCWTVAYVSNPGSGSVRSASGDGNASVRGVTEEYANLSLLMEQLRSRGHEVSAQMLLEEALGWLDRDQFADELFLYALSGGRSQQVASLITPKTATIPPAGT